MFLTLPEEKRSQITSTLAQTNRSSSPQRPRRWWVLAYPTSEPPSKLRAVSLGILIVGIFGVLNTVVSDTLIDMAIKNRLPYQWTFLTYLLLAAPMAAIAIANLAAQLHLLPRRALERA